MSASAKYGLLAASLMIIVMLCIRPLGAYIANVMEGQAKIARFGGRVERGLYRICGIAAKMEMSWAQYAVALLVFNAIGVMIVYALQRLQAWLPLNPQRMPAVDRKSNV